MEDLKKLADLLFEGALLKRIQRTGYSYLGTGGESVAAHSFGVALCAWFLGRYLSLKGKALDLEKVLKMAVLHDFVEARTGDFNAVNKLYDTADEEKALKDAFQNTPLEEEVTSLWKEYRKLETLESKVVHDADVLDLIIQLKEQKDLNNPYAEKWIDYAMPRLITEEGKALAQAILERDWCAWWYEFLVEKNSVNEG